MLMTAATAEPTDDAGLVRATASQAGILPTTVRTPATPHQSHGKWL